MIYKDRFRVNMAFKLQYFTKSELETLTASVLNGINFEKECFYREYGTWFIRKLGNN